MMRYQRVSPDCLPLSNGRKPTLRTCKEDDPDNNNVKIPNNFSTLEGKPLRIRSGSGSANPSPSQDHHFPHFSVSPDPVHSENQTAATPSAPTGKSPNHHEINNGSSPGGGAGGDVILQWGHNKRSRGSRAENRVVGDESSVHPRQVIKLQRRSTVGSEKQAILAAATAMPPPCASSYSRGANLRPCMPSREATASLLNRSVEERSGGLSRSEKRSPPSPPEKAHNKMASTCSLPNGFSSAQTAADPSMNQESTRRPPSDQETGGSGSGSGFAAAATTTTEKLNLDQFEWPRIYVSLSRKEKEDDFLAMKGTKLPQRPKKRAKNIDKTLQYCFPGMWLSDLTRGRYEVREKKCVKKKRRGLKGMESSDSE